MKIVYTYSSLARIAGLERILIDKMNYLSKNNEVYIITYEQGKHPFAFPLSSNVKHIDLNIRFFPLYKENNIKRLLLFQRLRIKYYQSMKKKILEINPDIIICTTYIPMEIHTIAKMNSSIIKILESHTARNYIGNLYKYKNNPFLKLYAKIDNLLIEKSIKKFDAIVTLTKGDSLLWKKINKTYIIPNSINSIINNSSSCKNKKIISVGRLCEQKGFDILIDAWNKVYEKHPDWSLSIFGRGDNKEILNNKIIKYKLGNVIKIIEPTTNIFDQYLDNSIYVMSSRYEGFGLVLIEAMSCGVPCISFDCPFGPSDIIKDGVDGIIVKEMNSTSLAKKICYLIENENIRIIMGNRAKKNVYRFLPEKIMPLWENLFKDLIEQKKMLLLQKK